MINEALRIHSTSAMGLPRVVPDFEAGNGPKWAGESAGGAEGSGKEEGNRNGVESGGGFDERGELVLELPAGDMFSPTSSASNTNTNAHSLEPKVFPPGTILSVPSYTLHRLPSIFGADVESFRPERWFEVGDPLKKRDNTVSSSTSTSTNNDNDNDNINPPLASKFPNLFSYGPRMCVGKNLAMMKLLLIIGSLVWRYDFVLEGGVGQEVSPSFFFRGFLLG